MVWPKAGFYSAQASIGAPPPEAGADPGAAGGVAGGGVAGGVGALGCGAVAGAPPFGGKRYE